MNKLTKCVIVRIGRIQELGLLSHWPAVSGELADRRIRTVEDAVKPGEEIEVKVIAVDSMGRINLSRRALTDKARARTTEESQRRLAPVPFIHST